jgi:hypothetical protein
LLDLLRFLQVEQLLARERAVNCAVRRALANINRSIDWQKYTLAVTDLPNLAALLFLVLVIMACGSSYRA